MTQGDLERLPGGVGRLMKDLENRIMEDIVRRIRQNCFSTATADWQITRLAQLGESEQYIQEYVMQALQATEKELDAIFSDDIYREYMGASRGYKVFGQTQVPFAENRKLQSLISSVKTQTKDELENITRTMGFVKKGFNNRMTVQSLSNFYRKTMDNAVMDIASGAFSYNEVLKRTINQMTQSGIRTIDYSSGVHNRIDVAARRAVLTGFRQVQGKINEQVANDLGTDSYEVTVHIGARPTHQVWEGKVYTYQQLVDICGLGSVTGLKGANCYHDYNAFIPGVSVRTYTDEQLDQIHEEENKKRLYNGKEYTTYEALQRQRELERHARKYREDVHLLELGGGSEDDINASKGHYRRILAEYGDFSKKMKLPLQKDRIYHDGLKVDMEAVNGKTTKQNAGETSIRYVEKRNPAGRTAIRNTKTTVKYDPDNNYSISIEGYPEDINNKISEAAEFVARNGSADKFEHLRLVDLDGGIIEEDMCDEQPGEVGYELWDFLKKPENQNRRFAFVHNHNTDSSFSETDMCTLLTTKQIPVMIAVRNDGVIYVAQRKGDVLPSGYFDPIYEEDIKILSERNRRGELNKSWSVSREELIVDNLLRDYTKEGRLVEYDGRKKR